MMKGVQKPSTVVLPAERRCPRCGAALGGFGPEGLCGACMFDAAIESGEESPTLDLLASGARRFGDYELLEEIARGGMGVIFKARQLKLNRIVAVKMILRGEYASMSELSRFRAEAETAARLQHPNIVAIHEVGECEEQPFFSMDYVEGHNLAQLIGNTPLPAVRAAKYLKTIAEAVQYAHEQGVLHRDLKPSNVLIDASDQPRVTDFGLAKRFSTQDSGLGTPDLTLTGQVLGSPSFMPPEQAAGKNAAIEAASDVYSLGAMLYHTLTGRPPFVAESVTATLRLVAEAEPVSPRLLVPTVPRDLETICLKCLQKEPQRRYVSARELADELNRVLREEPVHARPIAPAEKLWRWCRRNRALASTGSVALLLLVAVSIGSPIVAFRIDLERRRAEEAHKNETQLRQQAEAHALVSRQNAYASDLTSADHALSEGNLGLARKLLAAHRPLSGQEDLRGFEWRYLWSLSQGVQRKTLHGHSNYVSCVAYSPNGRLLASGSNDHTVRVWNTESGEPIAMCIGHSGDVISVAFSEDGQLLASGGNDGLVRLWDVRTWQIISTITNPSPRLAFSGHLLAMATGGDRFGVDGGTVKLWDYTAGKEVLSLAESGNRAAFSPDGKFLATANWKGMVKLWDVASRREIKSFPSSEVLSMAFSPDGRTLGWARNSGEVLLWNLAEGQPVILPQTAGDRTWSLAFSPDGQTLATAMDQGHCIALWSIARRENLLTLQGHGAQVHTLAFSPDGKSLASGGLDDTVMLWDPRPNRVQDVITNVVLDRWRWVGHPVFSPDGKILAAASVGGGIHLWEVATCQAVIHIDTTGLPMGFLPDGQGLLTRDDSFSSIEQWDTSGQMLNTNTALSVVSGRCYGDAFSADHKTIATSHDNRIVLCNTLTGEFLFALLPRSTARCVEFAPDGRTLATGHYDGTATVWDLTTRKPVWSVAGFRDTVSAVAYSPDGKLFAAGSWDRTIKIYDVAARKELATLTGHKAGVTRLAFSSDGKTLASASDDCTVRLWNLATSREVIAIKTGVSVCFVGFSPDGKTLATGGGGDGIVRLWRAPSMAEIGDLQNLGVSRVP